MTINILLPASVTSRNRVGVVVLDATIKEQHKFTSNVASEPIEEGSNVSDHITNRPEQITIEGFISNTPIDRDFFTQFFDFAQAAFAELTRVREQKELITVLTHYRLYENMAIISLTVPRTRQTGSSLRFSVTCKKVNIVGTSTFDEFSRALSPITGAVGEARRQINLGRQLGNEVADDVTQTTGEILRGIL